MIDMYGAQLGAEVVTQAVQGVEQDVGIEPAAVRDAEANRGGKGLELPQQKRGGETSHGRNPVRAHGSGIQRRPVPLKAEGVKISGPDNKTRDP